MKIVNFSKLLLLALVLAVTATACKKTPKSPTPIFPYRRAAPTGPSSPGDLATTSRGPTIPEESGSKANPLVNPIPPGEPIPPAARDDLSNYLQDRETFKQQTVYFDFDRYNIKPGELPKLQSVVNYLKANPTDKVLIEGNCDERGTPGYNMALGERRALAARESLVNLGVSADRIHTISYGEDRPADPGHNETAWAKNRRDDFVLLKPKSPMTSAPAPGNQ